MPSPIDSPATFAQSALPLAGFGALSPISRSPLGMGKRKYSDFRRKLEEDDRVRETPDQYPTDWQVFGHTGNPPGLLGCFTNSLGGFVDSDQELSAEASLALLVPCDSFGELFFGLGINPEGFGHRSMPYVRSAREPFPNRCHGRCHGWLDLPASRFLWPMRPLRQRQGPRQCWRSVRRPSERGPPRINGGLL
jgi:hypothetical protein